jgi:hypothetical protein
MASLLIGALAIALLAIPFARGWFPEVVTLVSLLALVLGIVGLVGSKRRQGGGSGYPLAGTGVGLLAFVVSCGILLQDRSFQGGLRRWVPGAARRQQEAVERARRFLQAGDVQEFQNFIKDYPNTREAETAEKMLKGLIERQNVIKDHPNTPEAKQAEDLLKRIKEGAERQKRLNQPNR